MPYILIVKLIFPNKVTKLNRREEATCFVTKTILIVIIKERRSQFFLFARHQGFVTFNGRSVGKIVSARLSSKKIK